MSFKHALSSVFAVLIAVCAPAQPGAHRSLRQFADYDAELRLPNGRVDVAGLTRRLQELGVTTYYWLIAHAATDWDDLKLFLPEANRAHIEVWAYVVPPSESAPQYGTLYAEPFRLDYQRWAEEIARLSLQHTNLTTWVIDDFYENHALFTPSYVGEMRRRARSINPQFKFFPLMYYYELNRRFAEDYHPVIDGVVAAYPLGREEIENAHSILSDIALVQRGELSFPNYTKSEADDFVTISQTAHVLPGAHSKLSFRERDNFTGLTSGYHFKQVLVDGKAVWEEDVAGGTNDWRTVEVDVTSQAAGKQNVSVAFRILDKKGVSNFGVQWRVENLRTEGLQLAAGLDASEAWKVEQRGAFEGGFGAKNLSGERRFHIPLIVMTAAQPVEFKLRHGQPASPERIAEWLRVCLEAMRDGKCEGVVTYCVDKGPMSPEFPRVRDLFQQFK